MKGIKPIALALLAHGALAAHAKAHKTPEQPKAMAAKIEHAILGNTPRPVDQTHIGIGRLNVHADLHVLYSDTETNMADTYDTTNGFTFEKIRQHWFRLYDSNLFLDAPLGKGFHGYVNLNYRRAHLFAESQAEEATFLRIRHNTENSSGSGARTEFDANYSPILEEAFITFYDQKAAPVFVKAGEFYAHFGRYEDPYTPAASIAQILTQYKAKGVEVGALLKDQTLEVSAWLSDMKLTGDDSGTFHDFDHFGARLAYHHQIKKVPIDLEVAFINDLRLLLNYERDDNSEQTSMTAYFVDDDLHQTSRYRRAGLALARLGWHYRHIDANVTYIQALRSALTDTSMTHLSTTTGKLALDAKPQAWSFGARYRFNAFNHEQSVEAMYELANDAGYMLMVDRHWKLNYRLALSTYLDAYTTYDHYRIANDIGWNADDSDFVTKHGHLSSWIIGLRAHM